MKAIRWGILATGGIAHKLAESIRVSEDGEMVAVASRTQEKADAFGDKWHVPRRYPTYEALAADPEVDVIYIATPHSHHYENMLMCLEAGKHILCEKAFTLNAAQAEECIALARANNLFLMEAMWMRYLPAILQARRWVDEGRIGDVRLVKADFCINVRYDPAHRLYNPHLGGGALLDLGIYPLSFTTMLLGLPDEVTATAHKSPEGVDELDAITLRYGNQVLAQLTCSMRITLPIEATIIGSEGNIRVHSPFFRPGALSLHQPGKAPKNHLIPYRSNGYIHEVEEVHGCLRAGLTESAQMTLAETLALMRLMDRMRANWGFRYPGE